MKGEKVIEKNLSIEATARRLNVSPPTVRKYAKLAGINFDQGFSEEGIEQLGEVLSNRSSYRRENANSGESGIEVRDELTISQVGRLVGINQGTVRSFVERKKFGHRKDVAGRKNILVLSKDEIEKIQEHYKSATPKNRGSIKEALSDLVAKSGYLVYIPGVKQLSGFSSVEKIKEFIQSSLLTGPIIIYKKVPAKIDVRLELEES